MTAENVDFIFTQTNIMQQFEYDPFKLGTPHAMIFVEDLVLCENTREEAEEQIELWRKAIENMGLRVSNTYHRLPVTTKLNMVDKKSRM